MRPCRTNIMEGIGKGIDPRGDHPFHREGFPLACLPADLASVEGLEGDMMLNAAAGVRADPLVGRQPDRDVVVMNQRNGTGQYIRAEEQDGGAALCCARQQYRYVSGSAQ